MLMNSLKIPSKEIDEISSITNAMFKEVSIPVNWVDALVIHEELYFYRLNYLGIVFM